MSDGPPDPWGPPEVIVDAPTVGEVVRPPVDDLGEWDPEDPPSPIDNTENRRRRQRGFQPYDDEGNPRPIVVATPLAPGFRGVVHPRWVERLFTTHDIYGPRVRLGVLWFFCQAAAIYAGADALAALFGVVAAVAALQACREWRKVYSQPSRVVAALGAGGITQAALYGVGAAGLAVMALIGMALVLAVFRRRRRWSRPLLDAASCTVRCGVFPGVAGACVVLTHRTSLAGIMILLGLVAAYELGDFLIGAESPGVLIGPLGGMLAVAAFTAPIAVFNISPFEEPVDAAVFGGAVAVFCPLSQVAGSLILPIARAWSPALRRIDSLLLTAPVWLLLLWAYLG